MSRSTFVIPNYKIVSDLDFNSKKEPYVAFDYEDIERKISDASRKRAMSLSLQGIILNLSNERARSISRLVCKYYKEDKIPQFNQLKVLPDINPNKNVILVLKKAKKIIIDFQSISPKVRRYYRNKYSLQQYSETIKILRNNFIEPTLRYFVGIPGDDVDTMFETLKELFSLRPCKLQVSIYSSNPVLSFFNTNNKFKAIFQKKIPYKIIRHYTANRKDIEWQYAICKRSFLDYIYWINFGNK